MIILPASYARIFIALKIRYLIKQKYKCHCIIVYIPHQQSKLRQKFRFKNEKKPYDYNMNMFVIIFDYESILNCKITRK